MILDAYNMFDMAAAVTVSRASTNAIDLSQARDISVSDIKLFIQFTTAPTAAAGTTINAALQGSNDNATWTTIQESGPQLVSGFASNANQLYNGDVAAEAFGPYRYLQVYYTTSATLTAGAVSAGLTLQTPKHPYYPRNYSA